MSLDSEVKSDSPVAVLGVGDRLRTEREARGISVDDVSHTLKISRRIVEQVEANAWGQLPGYTFARGVVRGYAKFVHLDAEPLLRELENAPLPKPPVLELPQSTRAAIPVPGQTEKRDRVAMVLGILIVAGAVMAYFLVPEDFFSATGSPPSAPLRSSVPAASPEPAVAAVALPESTGVSGVAVDPVAPGSPAVDPAASQSALPVVALAAVADGQSLVLRFDETSWVEVRDRNGVLVLSENVAAGSERILNLTAPISLALGNADGVRVSFRGKAVDLKPHTRQKVARLSLE